MGYFHGSVRWWEESGELKEDRKDEGEFEEVWTREPGPIWPEGEMEYEKTPLVQRVGNWILGGAIVLASFAIFLSARHFLGTFLSLAGMALGGYFCWTGFEKRGKR